MILLVGESSSGKSSVEKCLVNEYNYDKTISYTTRPLRDGEIDGQDYFKLEREEFEKLFNEGFFFEVGSYNGWLYGTTMQQYTNNTVAVLTPHGLRQLKKKIKDIDIVVVYIKVPRRDRLIQILKRGDNVDEAIRRNQSDVGQYDGIEDEADLVIENPSYMLTPKEISDKIIEYIVKRKYGVMNESY